MCSEAVLKYLQSTNRPYSANDIVLNLHNVYSKNVIQKSLDELVEKGLIREKVYGKQKIYCVVQISSDEGNEEDVTELNELGPGIQYILARISRGPRRAILTLHELSIPFHLQKDAIISDINITLLFILRYLSLEKIRPLLNIDQKSKDMKKLEQELKLLEVKLKDIQSQPTTPQAEGDNARLKKTNGILKEKLSQLKKGVSIISKEEWKKTEEMLCSVTKESKKRDRWLKDMTDAVLENWNSSKNQLYEEIGIEL